MAIVQRNVQIKASPQETMALLSDASRWPDWYPGMTEIDVAAPLQGYLQGEVNGHVHADHRDSLDYQPGKLQLFQMDGMLSGARSLGTRPGRRWNAPDHDVRLRAAGRCVRQDR